MGFNRIPYLRNRIAFFCAAFILFFFFGVTSGLDIAVAVFAALNMLLGIVCLIRGRRRKDILRTVGVAVVVSALGLLWACTVRYIYFYPSARFIEKYDGKECGLVLRVDKVESEGGSYGNYNCSIIMCEDEYTEEIFGIRPSLRLTCFGGDFADKGDMVYLESKIMLPEKKTDTGFNEEMYLRARHIFVTVEYNGELLLLRKGKESVIDRVRSRLSDGISMYVGAAGSDEEAISKCMLLGDKSGVSSELKEVFRVAGISHVLSVSGLHLSILFMTVSVFLGLRRRSPRRRFVYAEAVSCILVLIYMALADFTPSIMRAGFMLIFMNLYSARMYYKRKLCDCIGDNSKNGEGISQNIGYYSLKYGRSDGGVFDSVSSLFCAGALIVIISPCSVFDVGMQLSFMSTFGILAAVYIFGSYTERIKNPVLRAVAMSLLITYSAVGFTLPINIYNFGALSTLSAVANLIITPLMTPLLAILLVLALLSVFSSVAAIGAVCSLLGWIAQVLCGIAVWCARSISSLPFASVAAHENLIAVIVFAAFFAFIVVCLFYGMKRTGMACYFGLTMLYFVYMHLSLFTAFFEYGITKVNLCTVARNPYFCVSSKNDRIFFHDCSGIASDSVIRKSLGNDLYRTDIYYLVVPCAGADLESLYFNITYLDRDKDIKKVLLPSKDISVSCGMDMEDYAEFIYRLEGCGLQYGFYGDKFSVSGIDFSAIAKENGIGFVFEDKCVIFAQRYDEDFADSLSEGLEDCIYYCDDAVRTDNGGYNSGARLFVTSPYYKNVDGAQSIPTRKPVSLDSYAVEEQ